MSGIHIGTVIKHCGLSGIGRLQVTEGDATWGMMFFFGGPDILEPGTKVEYRWNRDTHSAYKVTVLRVLDADADVPCDPEHETLGQRAQRLGVTLEALRAVEDCDAAYW